MSYSIIRSLFAGRYHRHTDLSAIAHEHDADYAPIDHEHASSAMWFVADRTCISPHGLNANAWTELAFPCGMWGNPIADSYPAGWNGTSHQIREPQYGLWLYQIAVGGLSVIGGQQYIGLRDHLPGTPVITESLSTGVGQNRFSGSIIKYIDTDMDLRPIVFVDTAATFQPTTLYTWFRASRLAPAV